MPYSMLQLPCCCSTGCTHNYRVFVPCQQTPASMQVFMPVTHKDNLEEYGLTSGTIYDFNAILCDDYCGSWQCIDDADVEDNWCYLSASPFCSNTPCEDWNDEIDPPYMFIRPTEWSVALSNRWTDLETDDCCDTPPLLCNVDCGFGDVIPSDCASPGCYDPGLLSWSVQSSFGQSYPATAIYAETSSGCTQVVSPGTQISTSMSAQIVSADSYISSTENKTLIITVLVKTTTTTSPLFWTNWCDPFDPDPPCCWICLYDDPDCGDSPGATFDRYFRYNIRVPCMVFPSISGACYNPADPTVCVTPAVPAFCGGALPSQTAASFNNVGFATTQQDGHAIGWGGNALCFTFKQQVSWLVPPWCFLSSAQQGAGKFELSLRLSLPARPAACP